MRCSFLQQRTSIVLCSSLLNGHVAHIDINIIRLMQENQIICLVLPPHSIDALQPIDVVLFNNVKTDWSNIISNHLKAGNKSIKNAHFPRLMKRLFVEKQAFSTTRIVSSFTRSGKRSTLQTEALQREFLFTEIYIPRNRVNLRDEESPTRNALCRTVTFRSAHLDRVFLFTTLFFRCMAVQR